MKSFAISAFKVHRAQTSPLLEKLAQATQMESTKEELMHFYRMFSSV
jgi:hypothetical protein